MKAKVDADTCTGCELCVDTCPDVFEMSDGLAITKAGGTVPEAAEETCREASDSCPVEAISIED